MTLGNKYTKRYTPSRVARDKKSKEVLTQYSDEEDYDDTNDKPDPNYNSDDLSDTDDDADDEMDQKQKASSKKKKKISKVTQVTKRITDPLCNENNVVVSGNTDALSEQAKKRKSIELEDEHEEEEDEPLDDDDDLPFSEILKNMKEDENKKLKQINKDQMKLKMQQNELDSSDDSDDDDGFKKALMKENSNVKTLKQIEDNEPISPFFNMNYDTRLAHDSDEVMETETIIPSSGNSKSITSTYKNVTSTQESLTQDSVDELETDVPSSDNSKSMARRRLLAKKSKHLPAVVEEEDASDNEEDVADSSDDDDLPVSSLINNSPNKTSTSKKKTPKKSSSTKFDINPKSSIRKSLLFSNKKDSINEESNNDCALKSIARKSKLNEASTKKGKGKSIKVDKNQQTLTQMDKKNKLKPKAKKVYKVKECIYDIPAFEELPKDEVYKKSVKIKANELRPLEILNVRKGNGYKLECLLNYNNGLSDWVFMHGCWTELPNVTESFMKEADVDFELCGYQTDPRIDIKTHDELDEFGNKREVDFDGAIERMRNILLKKKEERENVVI